MMGKMERLSELADYHQAVAEYGFRTDGYKNMLNKVGTCQDNSNYWQYQPDAYVSDIELTRLYETNGLFSRIINRPAEDAIARGIDLSDLGDELEQEVQKRLSKLDWQSTAVMGEQWARLYGGAIGVMIVDDGCGLEEPLDWKKVKRLEEIRVFERAVVQPDYLTLYDFGSAFLTEEELGRPYGQPLFYDVYSVYGRFKVHYSRCLVFRHGKMPEYSTQEQYRFWGIPEYLKIKDALRETVTSHSDGVKLLERSVLGIYKMKGLSQILSTDEGEDKVITRLQVIDMARHILNSLAIDNDGEDYQYINASLAGVSDVIDRTCNMLSAVTEIPQTILFGKSPSGMDSTGDMDMENYYQLLSRIQSQNLRRNTEIVVKMILTEMVVNGDIEKELPEYEVRFNPFKQQTEEEIAGIESTKAGTEMTKAQTAQIYVDMQAIDPSEIRAALAKSDSYEIQEIVDEDHLELPEGAFSMGQEEEAEEQPEEAKKEPVEGKNEAKEESKKPESGEK